MSQKMQQEFQQARIARDISLELLAECTEITRKSGEAACLNHLITEAVSFFVERGEAEDATRGELQSYIAGVANPLVLLRQIVAEQRAVARLGLADEIHNRLAISE